MGKMRHSYKMFVENPERNRPLGRRRRRWEDNIRMDLRETGCEVVEWIHLAEDRDRWWAVMKTVMKIRVT
jgi:hypothetical protein